MPLTVDQISDYLAERASFLGRLLYNEDGTATGIPQGQRERILAGFDEVWLLQAHILAGAAEQHAATTVEDAHLPQYGDDEHRSTIGR